MSIVIETPKIFGTGLVALDLVMGLDPNTPVQSWAGGTCGNVMAIMSYLGWDAYPIARMNGDPASERVRTDLSSWNVHLDFANCAPTGHTPIIIQQIRRGRDGTPTHRFLWTCPHCGQRLPSYRPVTQASVETIVPHLQSSSVFFLDRLSRAALTLAESAASAGAVIVFEPSGKTDDKLFAEALGLAHVVKYSDQRLADAGQAMSEGTATRVEIQTVGADGLRYRHRLDGKVSSWIVVPAFPVPNLVDSCGSGDWCTGGFLMKAAGSGLNGLMSIGEAGLNEALRFGQALAAWNCGFEGARGGMYLVSRPDFHRHIRSIREGHPTPVAIDRTIKVGASVACPACPDQPDKLPRAARSAA